MYANNIILLYLIGQLPDGSIQAKDANSIVPESVLHLIWLLRKQGISFQDIVQRLRPRTVPSGYAYHNWIPGKLIHAVCICRKVNHISVPPCKFGL